MSPMGGGWVGTAGLVEELPTAFVTWGTQPSRGAPARTRPVRGREVAWEAVGQEESRGKQELEETLGRGGTFCLAGRMTCT